MLNSKCPASKIYLKFVSFFPSSLPTLPHTFPDTITFKWPSFLQDYPPTQASYLNSLFSWHADSFLSVFKQKTNKTPKTKNWKPKRHKERGGAGHAHYIDLGDGIMGVCICPDSPNYTEEICTVLCEKATNQTKTKNNYPWIPIVLRVKSRICDGLLTGSYVKKRPFSSLISSSAPFPFFIVLQPHWLSFCFLKMPSSFPSYELCIDIPQDFWGTGVFS